mmetsp:Transcript_19931/g.43333  ORF Transcript_19931/g.43333 Transcript_19931/m.43333 type:complete len:118 (+) Transcript_19931:614-967(+)
MMESYISMDSSTLLEAKADIPSYTDGIPAALAALDCMLLDIVSAIQELVAIPAAATKKSRRDGMAECGDENDNALVMLLWLVETTNKNAMSGFVRPMIFMFQIRCASSSTLDIYAGK